MRVSQRARRGLAVLAAAIGFGVFAGQSHAQVNFIVPADAPDGGAGTVGILRVFVPAPTQADPNARQPVNNQDDARTMLMSGLGNRTTAFGTSVNHVGDAGGSGHFGNDQDNINGDNKSYLFRGNIQVPAAGTYTFNVASDDGFTLAFNGGTLPFSGLYNSNGGNPGSIVSSYNGNANGALTFFGGRGTEDTGGNVSFPSAGTYHFDLSFHDGCCGDAVELSAAQGAKSGFGASFALVGGSAAPVTKFAGNIVGGFQVATVHGNNANSLADALNDLNAVQGGDPPASRGGGTPVIVTGTSPTINYIDPQNANSGGHGPTQTFPGDGPNDDDKFSFGAQAQLNIPAGRGGHYSYLVYSDDSAQLRFINLATNTPVPILTTSGNNANKVDSNADGILDALSNPGNCCNDIIGVWDLQPGNYRVEIVNNEQGGGAGLFLYGASGDQTAFDGNLFQLLGENLDVVPGGLQLVAVPEPGTLGLLGLGATAFLARRKRA
jgi:hypothetical protein